MVNSVNSAGTSGTGGADAPAYFLLMAWSPPDATPRRAPPSDPVRSVDRFLNDWQCRCLPLPVCAATTKQLFEAYRFWCDLQGELHAAPIEGLVSAADSAGLARKRHLIQGFGDGRRSQHTVMHPPGVRRASVGVELFHAVTAFADALAAWKVAASGQGA